MKNFTKQNFKTNPLWIRLLIMTFMLLAGAGNVWGYWVTGGAFAGWGNWTELTYESDSRYVVAIQNINSEFKLSTTNNYNSCWNDLGTSDSNVSLKINNDNNHKILGGSVDILCFDPTGYDGKGAVWTEKCAILKHPWDGGSNWYWKVLKKNSDGTFSITAIYRGGGLDYRYENMSSYVGSPTKVNNPQSGDECVFTFNPSNKTITITKVVTCDNNPDFSVSLSKSEVAVGCTDVTASITGDDSQTVTCTWSSTDPSVATINSSTGDITIKAAGTTTIKATTTEAGGFCGGVEKTATLTVKSPSVTVSANDNSLCEGETLTLTATLTNCGSDNSIQWYNGGNLINGATNTTLTINPVTTANSGNYKAVVSDGILCSAIESSINISVNALPSAPTNLGSATICNGDKTTLPEVTGSWYEGANTITPLASREVQPTKTTSYFATSKSNNCESSLRTEYVVTVKSLADANNYELTKTSEDYTGTTITLQTSDVNVNNNAGAVESIYFKQNGSNVTPINVGDYEVYVTTAATNDICAGNIKIGTFEITCPPIAAPDITASATVCAGTQVTLSNYNGNNTVKWYSNSACAEEVTEQITPTNNEVYYAKAYHEASGCYSSEYSTLTFTVNPKPIITITGNNSAVLYEDVTLTATGNNIDDVTWIADKGTITEDATDPKKAILTYDQTGTVTVTATATSAAGCTSVAATKTVKFSEENCETGNTKILFSKEYGDYYGFNIAGGIYLYSYHKDTKTEYTGAYPGKEITDTEKINGIDYYVYEFKKNESTDKLAIVIRATYDYGNKIGKTKDIYLNNPGATYTIKLTNGTNATKQDYQETKKGSDTYYDVYIIDDNTTSTGGGLTITTPAVKTVSVTSDEDGNVTMVGQVVKTGCDTQAILGLQYKKQKQDGTYDDVNYTTYPNPGTKEAISAGKTFTVTTKLEDGTYKVRARIDNSHATNGYGEDITVVVNTVKTAISNVTLNYCDEYGEGIPDPNPMCKGATAYVKLSYVGSKYSDIKWLVEGVETDDVTNEGDGVWSYIIQGTGQLSVELRNDANKVDDNPTWATSDKLSFTMKEEPTAPYISINPASGVLCEGYTATITVTNPSIDCAYKLVDESPEAEFVEYESGDLKYSVGSVGKYYVAAKHIACPTNEYTSNQVEINQIISTSATISIEPDEEVTTTPWEPVTITVIPQEGYVYELSYTGNNLASVDGVIIKQNGDSYTYYIPRPDSWSTGDATPVRTAVEYGIKAQLKVDGEASECTLKNATAIIHLKDEDNEDCE